MAFGPCFVLIIQNEGLKFYKIIPSIKLEIIWPRI